MDRDLYNMVEAARAIVARYDQGIAFEGGGAEAGLIRLLAKYTAPEPPEDEYDQAHYWAEVKAIAREARKESDPHDAVFESVDGSSWVIYQRHALRVMEYTRNDDAFEEYGDLSSEGGWSGMLARLAFCAMRADVEDALRELEDEEPEEEEEEDDEESGVDNDEHRVKARKTARAATAACNPDDPNAVVAFLVRARVSWLEWRGHEPDWVTLWWEATADAPVLRAALLEEYGSLHTPNLPVPDSE